MINGVPRSGTSLLGQIFNSCPDVAYRYQPLFSYPLKGFLNTESSQKDIDDFFLKAYQSRDEMILQTHQRARQVHSTFSKNLNPDYLAVKHVRYHHLLENILKKNTSVKIIGIIRHPCGVINSWHKTRREFDIKWNIKDEWRTASKKNKDRKEEYFGFMKWKEAAELFIKLRQDFPQHFKLIQYEDLVENKYVIVSEIFKFTGMEMTKSTIDFLDASNTKEVDDPDSVFRTNDVIYRWKKELDPEIQHEIISEISRTPLEQFLDRELKSNKRL
tara:strand:+ start:2571 stop:3389 length:819 start_codon:yes stop_codon:yes gene_type:complete